jgi:acyl-CoA thioesterase
MSNIDKIRAFFKDDVFADSTVGIVIEDADENYARCSLITENKHKNAGDVVMGGVLFSLADYTFAVASNAKDILDGTNCVTQTLSSNISYLSPARIGEKLIAEAKCVKRGRTACYYTVNIYSEKNPSRVLAVAAINGFTSVKS